MNLLNEIEIDQETFLFLSKKGLESEDKKFYEQLITCDNFIYFKNMIIKRNIQLEEEAIKLMENKNSDMKIIINNKNHKNTNDDSNQLMGGL
jgi:hypothetical protein